MPIMQMTILSTPLSGIRAVIDGGGIAIPSRSAPACS